MKVSEQDEGPVLDTAEAAASGLSAEYMQKDLVLPFPQAADELQVQLSTASFPTLCSTAKEREQSQHKASPPLGPLPGPPGQRGIADWRAPLCSQQLHHGAAGWRTSFEGAKVSLVCPSAASQLHNGAMDAVHLHYTKLAGCKLKGPKQLMLGSCWAARSLAEAIQSCLLPVPTALYLLQAARHSSVFPQPTQGGSSSLTR